MTQAELATALGVGSRTVGAWERGENVPRNRMGMLLKFFGADVVGAAGEDEPLGLVSDVALISELLRRAVARDSRQRNHGGG